MLAQGEDGASNEKQNNSQNTQEAKDIKEQSCEFFTRFQRLEERINKR